MAALVLLDWDTVGLAPPERDLWVVTSDNAELGHDRAVAPPAGGDLAAGSG
jgi:hypothetical protein